MPNPYSPRTSFDVEINLNTDTRRTFQGGTSFANKHILVIPKTTVDTAQGLLFSDAASVTIIGGHFKGAFGSVSRWTNGNHGAGYLSFTNCKEVYLEGVIVDNINGGPGSNLIGSTNYGNDGMDAIFVSGKTANTIFTAVNCCWLNVQGTEAGFHGDVYQGASYTQGITASVRMYNVTATCNYQGIFLDPQDNSAYNPPGRIRNAELRRVNIRRSAVVTPYPRLLYWYSSQADYTNATSSMYPDYPMGYPIKLEDVWADNSNGTTVANAIWPTNSAGSQSQFPDATYQAKIVTNDPSGVEYAHWPGMQGAGKAITNLAGTAPGRVWKGSPPGGDFCKPEQIGIGYKAGTDLVNGSTPVDPGPVTPPQDTPLPAGSNLIRIANWVKGGTGTGTVNATTGAISVTPANDGTRTYFRQRIPVEIGKTYAITWDLFTSTQMWRMLGTTEGGTEIVNVNVSTFPENKITFKATTTFVWFEFNRVSAGTPTVGSIRFEEVAPGSSTARRLNGRNQLFRLDVGAAGLRKWNAIQYFGGWAKFHHLPTAGAYLLDFATPDAVASGGQQRARILWDPTASKMLASNAGVTKYAENAITGIQMKADEWHYVGMILMSDGDVKLVYDQTIGGVTSGTGIPEVAQFGTVLQLGARTGSTPTGYAPAILADWIWCAEFLPTNAQIQALAAGNRPLDIDGFTPSFYWPMVSTGPTEDSLTGTAALTATNTPITVVGPSFIMPPPDEVLPLLMF